MAFTRPAGRLLWLLIGPLLLESALPAAVLESSAMGLNRSPETMLAQAPIPAAAAIPTEVQGWVDGAIAAYERGDRAEALRLQKQVVAWVQVNRPALDVFRAGALSNLGAFYSGLGRRQEALAPTEEAVKIRRELAKTNPAFQGDLARSLSNLGIRYSELGRRQEALAQDEEAVKIRRELAKTNPAYLGDLAGSLTNLGISYSELGRRQEALAPTEEAVKIVAHIHI